MRLNLPNAITLFRIFLVPLLVVTLLTPPSSIAWVKEQVAGSESVEWLGDLVAWLAAWRELVAVVIFLTAGLGLFIAIGRRRARPTPAPVPLDDTEKARLARILRQGNGGGEHRNSGPGGDTS